MVRRIFLLVLILVFAACSSIVIADDDSNGNIRVEVTKIDNSWSYVVLAVVGIVVLIAVVLSIVIVVRSRQLQGVRHGTSVSLKGGEPQALSREEYYTNVFERPVPDVKIVDEKSSPVVLASIDPVGDVGSGSGKDVDRYLKEDERIVINVLRMKHDSCSQATLRVVTDFSKARLSRILSELEERGIIYKEQQGRKNLITLKV